MKFFRWPDTTIGWIILPTTLLAFLSAIVLLFVPHALALLSQFVSYSIKGFNTIDFLRVANLISNLTFVLLGIIVPIFVLTVTLIGNAARLAKEQQASTEQKSKEDFDKEIAALNKKLEKISPDALDELKEKINDLRIKKSYTEEKIKEIETKYATLGLKNSVLVPAQFLILSLVVNSWIISWSGNHVWQLTAIGLGVFLLYLGVKRVIFTLYVVQEVSLIADSRKSEELRNSLIDALKTVEKEREPKPYIKFKERPPFVFKPNSEVTVGFDVNLKMPGNKEAKNVDIWFMISPEIQILPGSAYSASFKQHADYTIANANTTRYKFELVRMHTGYSGELKLKTTVPGKFTLRHKVDCDNHAESADAEKEIDIIVKE